MTCYKNTLHGPHGCWNCNKRTRPSTKEYTGLHPDCKNCHHSIGHCQWERTMNDPLRELRLVLICKQNSIYRVEFSSDERIDWNDEQ